MSRLTPERGRAWRLFFESAVAIIDVLESDFEHDVGFPVQWYDVLVHLEEAPDGRRMNELAGRILYSKSGLTRIVDRMEKAGLVTRHRPDDDRRSIFVRQTPQGREAMEQARRLHHAWIIDNFSQLLADQDIHGLVGGLEKLSTHIRSRRPGRING